METMRYQMQYRNGPCCMKKLHEERRKNRKIPENGFLIIAGTNFLKILITLYYEKGSLKMNENIKLFLEKLEADKELQAKFSQINEPDEAYALAASVQDGFTKDEFITEMTKIKEAIDENLSDEDLAKSSGGSTSEAVSLAVTVSVSVTGAVVSYAASAAV